MAKWIWRCGDFALYHHMLLSSRREECGHGYPCMWPVSRPGLAARFRLCADISGDTTVRAVSRSRGMIILNGKKYPLNEDVPVSAGPCEAEVLLDDTEHFPCFFIGGGPLATGENWACDGYDGDVRPAQCDPAFESADDDPFVFPFSYEKIMPVGEASFSGGRIYDLGNEYFCRVTLPGWDATGKADLVYGESEEEVRDHENAIVREELGKGYEKTRPARALRYLFVRTEKQADCAPVFEHEYLPLEDKASFGCGDEKIARIWDMCVRTFHLNSREFYLDGIKRDRWVWSGDAYQSFMVNRYLYDDPGIVRRTLQAMLGRPPYRVHINTINDYSMYLIFALRDYWEDTKDTDFVRAVWPEIKELYGFIKGRLDERGYMVKRGGDWIFIDWGVIDKDGTLCAEQILLAETYRAMSRLSRALGEEDVYSDRIEPLEDMIRRDFWREDKHAFIDCFDSGKEHVSRQCNIIAVLFGFATERETELIARHVFDDPGIPPITTPYFKLFELLTLCSLGRVEDMQRYIGEYWGGMADLGADCVWEQYIPGEEGKDRLAMYGMPFGRSLCHAWGSGPILLLGRFVAGVRREGDGAHSYTVLPHPGIYDRFDAVVPVRGGTVRVTCDEERITVTSDTDGGALIWNGSTIDIPKGETVCAARKE